MAPLVSIVILNWNGRKYLEQFLPSVMASSYENFRVVVADNASTDDSIPFMRSYYPEIEVIELKKNYGFSRGYNDALKFVKSDYYVLLNSDVEVDAGWIGPVVELMENNPLIGACQPKLLQFYQRDHFEYSGASGGWIDQLGYPFARGRIFDYCEKDSGQYDETAPVFWASGAAMFVRAELYHRLGGLDEYFFAHQEEIDFCWRMHRMGYAVYCCPKSVVYHVGGGTLPKGNMRKVFLNFRNNLIMMAKNLPLGVALVKIPVRVVLDIVSAVKSLLGGEARYFVSVGKAHLGFMRWMMFADKQPGRKGSVGRKWTGYFRGSVVWAHFVKGKKTFAEIVEGKR